MLKKYIGKRNRNINSNKQTKILEFKNRVGTILCTIGAILFAFMAFYEYNISIWIAYIGFLIILCGISFILHGYIKTWIIFSVAIFLAFSTFIISISIQEPIKEIPSNNDVKIFSNDSLVKLQHSISATENTLKNTNEKLKIIENHFVSSQKPIISISEFKVDTLLPNKRTTFECKFENTGNSFAKNITYYTGIALHSTPNYDGEFPVLKLIKAPPLAPQKSYYTNFVDSKILTQEWYDLIFAKKWYMYYYGIFYFYNEYNIKDSSGFCVIYDVISKEKCIYNTSHNF